MASRLGQTRLMYVADREADLMALMVTARNSGTPVDWLGLTKHNRTLKGGDKLWARVSSSEALGELRFTMAQRQGHKAREVIQQVWCNTAQKTSYKSTVVGFVRRRTLCSRGRISSNFSGVMSLA